MGKAHSDRLMAMVRREIAEMERRYREDAAEGAGPDAAARAKARVDSLANLTRTLEKLFELKRLEAADAEAREGPELTRKRDELIGRLKRLDARRARPTGIFEALGGPEDA